MKNVKKYMRGMKSVISSYTDANGLCKHMEHMHLSITDRVLDEKKTKCPPLLQLQGGVSTFTQPNKQSVAKNGAKRLTDKF